MWIDPFVAGVVATILVELAVLIGIGLYNARRK